mmetsp:Transcript_17902/g.15809  ORF Transcript_17902/g.15809 Transcript_17902/m.15809 type:complete len:113 (-) Transcript_17902:1404-1742(-)
MKKRESFIKEGKEEDNAEHTHVKAIFEKLVMIMSEENWMARAKDTLINLTSKFLKAGTKSEWLEIVCESQFSNSMVTILKESYYGFEEDIANSQLMHTTDIISKKDLLLMLK